MDLGNCAGVEAATLAPLAADSNMRGILGGVLATASEQALPLSSLDGFRLRIWS